TIVDGSGKYMIPGLWDAHGHLENTDALTPAMFPLLIVNGITYFRDTSANLDFILPMRKKAEEASRSNGMAPQVFMSGPHIDGLQTSWDTSVSAVSAKQAESIVDSLINAGVNEIKLYDLLSPDIYFEVLSMANSKGLNVSAHVPMAMDVVEASDAGLASMEHMRHLEFSLSSDWETLLKQRQEMIAESPEKSGRELRGEIHEAQRLHAFQTQDEERRATVLRTLAENNTWQVPNLTLGASAEHRIFTSDEWKKTFRYLPESVRSEWEERAISMAEEPPSEVGLARANWAYDMIPRLAEAGIGIMAGTDMPLALQTPGFSLHEELALLVHAGLTPMQAIEAATLHPAQYFGLENQQGTIAKDMKADLVILDANPLEDITNTQRLNAVMRNGHLHTRDDLDKILDQLEKHGKVLAE
ncbi:MAG: amidohydrolase family protein, partial [Balneolales bacterium]